MMRSKLIKKADKRTRISSEIKESILNDPQSKVCQELLDQLNEVLLLAIKLETSLQDYII